MNIFCEFHSEGLRPTAISFANEYKTLTLRYIGQLEAHDQRLWEHCKAILLKPLSYAVDEKENQELKAAIQRVIDMAEKTSDKTAHRIDILHSLLDENHLSIFPLNSLELNAKRDLEDIALVGVQYFGLIHHVFDYLTC